MFGRDELLLQGLDAGAKAAIGSIYNFSATLHGALIEAYSKGDAERAQTLQTHAIEMIDVIYGRFGGAPAAKAVMAMTGIDCGSVRPPLAPLSSEEIRELRDVLQKVAAAPHMGC